MTAFRGGSSGTRLFLFLAAFLLTTVPAEAYIGPGAGVAFVSSFLVVLITLFLALFTLLTWPIRWAIQTLRGRTALRKSRVRRVIVLGLDGQDPNLTEKLMEQGELPNFKKLCEAGSYSRLGTSLPAESPVAWSCFQTGSNPGKHRVFDFLVPNRKSYLPELCSARIEPPRRNLRIGPYQIPLGKPLIQFERKSQSFWKILGDYGIFSTILRVPTSFPPEKFRGVLLSAMSVPDLRGTQGTFSYYSSDASEIGKMTGGEPVLLKLENGSAKTSILGPENPIRQPAVEMRLPLEVRTETNGCDARLRIGKKKYELSLRKFSPWVSLEFRPGLGMKIHGMCRFYLLETSPHLKLYMTPINIAPDRPALPVSHPVTYSMYLSKTQGRFCTLGLAEDTWALNERVLDEKAFVEQVYLTHEERERMFCDALSRTRRGAVVCVFDITDRMQHMFWRYQEKDHPANAGKDTEKHRDEILQLYRNMDDLVGRTMEQVDDDSVLVVMSDHGFNSFRRGINLNTWLYQNGYMTMKNPPRGEEYFHDVDWEQTRVYAVGLGGLYLNVKGRESRGIVAPGEMQALKDELREKLKSLRDEATGERAISEVYDTREAYSGPYRDDGPDLVVGCRVGYRTSWLSVTGGITDSVFEDNVKSWSGDHCMNPPEVPGILFCNRKMDRSSIEITDIAPTVLDLFGVPVPGWMDGESFLSSGQPEGQE